MKNLILDGNNIMFRAYHIPKKPHLVNDLNVSPVSHFFTMVLSYVKKFQPDNIYISWDKKLNPGGVNFRKTLVEYKENRIDNPNIQDIYKCIDVIILLSNALGFKTIYPLNLEADDVISYLASNLKGETVIVSSDKDLFQLVGEHTTCYNTVKNTIIDSNNFKSFLGVSKDNYILYKAILGDKSDNIEGLPRFGEVKSKRLASCYDDTELTSEQVNIVDRNIQIMDLSTGYKLSEGEEESYKEQLEEVTNNPLKFNEEDFKNICETYELYPLTNKLEEWRSLTENKNLLEEWFSVQ